MALKPAKRICSLLPSATEIVGRLGLVDRLVCVTHECDVLDTSNESKDVLDRLIESGRVARVTSSAINPDVYTQAKIDQLVSSSLGTGDGLYGVDNTAMAQKNPDLIITQELCSVCAPSSQHVTSALEAVARERKELAKTVQGTQDESKAPSTSSMEESVVPRVLSLEPQSLLDVGNSFIAVANACGEEDRGTQLHKTFLADLKAISDAISGPPGAAGASQSAPKAFILEWLDPPFDAGHWVPEVLSIAMGRIADTSCAPPASSSDQSSTGADAPVATNADGSGSGGACGWDVHKSRRITWEAVAAADPDVLVVACCGFDFLRNCGDGQATLSQNACARGLRAVQSGRVFAVDGNRYLARPGPSLVQGAAAVAACIWNDDPVRMRALVATGLLPERDLMWGAVPLQLTNEPQTPAPLPSCLPPARPVGVATGATSSGASSVRGHASAAAHVAVAESVEAVEDIEDAHVVHAWDTVHAEAAARGDNFYEDPETKLMVMTEVVHRSRGTCCGRACRHCPYMHDRVSMRARPHQISRPAWLVRPKTLEGDAAEGGGGGGAAGGATAKSSQLPNGGRGAAGGGTLNGAAEDSGAAAGSPGAQPAAAAAACTDVAVHVHVCGCSESDVQAASVLRGQGEEVVLVAPLDADSREVEGTGMHAKDACDRAKAAGVPLVGLPVHEGGPAHEVLLRDALAVAVGAAAEGGRVCGIDVKLSLGCGGDKWRHASEVLQPM